MALPSGTEVLGLVAGIVVLYLLVSIGYRRILFGMLPDPDERSPEADEPVAQGELHCPHCGAINDDGFEKCYECAGRLPAEPIEAETE